jgi:hypothetical protein
MWRFWGFMSGKLLEMWRFEETENMRKLKPEVEDHA